MEGRRGKRREEQEGKMGGMQGGGKGVKDREVGGKVKGTGTEGKVGLDERKKKGRLG